MADKMVVQMAERMVDLRADLLAQQLVAGKVGLMVVNWAARMVVQLAVRMVDKWDH